MTVKPGESIEFDTVDAPGGQLTAISSLADLAKLDFGKVSPVTGPVYIDGAEPGDAVKDMIDLLTRRTGMSAVEAHMLCSVCGDLRISEIVDVPNCVVSIYFPCVVLE